MSTRIILSTILLWATSANADPSVGADLQIGLLGTLEANPSGAGATQHDAAPTVALTPWVESLTIGPLNVGAEFTLMWIKGDTDQHVRRLILIPNARVRYQRPLTDKIFFDASAGLGPSWWTSSKDAKAGVAGTSNRIGWGLRFGAGAGYEISSRFALHGSLGYFSNTSYGNDLTKSIDGLTIGLGARSQY